MYVKAAAIQTLASYLSNYTSKPSKASDFLLWTPTHGPTREGRPTKFLNQIFVNTGCRVENLPRTLADRDRWRERI